MNKKITKSCILFLLMAVQAFAQTTFNGLGAADSGGTGFKTITNIPEIVVSNNMDHDGTEIFGTVNGTGATEIHTLKADGIDAESFDVDDITISNFTGSSTYSGSTIEFKDKDGITIQTMSNPGSLTTTPVSIGSLYTSGNTLPVTGVAEIIITVTGGGSPSNYTLESITYSNVVIPSACTDPDIPTVVATPSSVCNGNTTTLTITGSLNDATQWVVYTGSCGGSQVGTTTSSSIVVTPTGPSTTYYIRGEGGCVTPGSCGQVTVTVNGNPTVAFTAPADLCVDAGVQTGLGGGTPPQGTATGDQGVYSGTGVTDDGNGMTYSFDPAAAGVGTHTITYTYTNENGCADSASDDVEVFAVPSVTFTALADLCIDAGVQTGLGGGAPPQGTATGDQGVYSGTGVTDDGNGMTYSFDPAAAGVGTHTITYTYTNTNGCTGSATDDVEVFAVPNVTFTALADLCVDAGVQTGLGGGTPPQGTASGDQGVYSGTGVTDDGNGMTYSFDPAAAGVGTHTITYTYTNENGCTDSASDDVEVFALPDASVDDSGSPTLVANTAGATYQWYDCNTNMAITGETNQSFTATMGGEYAVDVTVNGCTVRSNCIVVQPLSTVDVAAINFEMYPNPTSGIVNITGQFDSLRIYNLTGKKVFETSQSEFSVAELPSGVYFVTIASDKGDTTVKRLIKR